MDFEVYYYLSEQDKQIFIESLPFSARGQYLRDYDSWFYDPSNPITNREAVISKTINFLVCANGSLQTNSYTVTGTASSIDNQINAIIANFTLAETLNTNYSFTFGIDSNPSSINCPPAIDTSNTTGSSRITPIPPTPPPIPTFTLYYAYCLNGVATTSEQTFPLAIDRNQATLNIYEKLSTTPGVDPASIKTSPSVIPINTVQCSTSSPPPSPPTPPSSQNVSVYIAYCNGNQVKTELRTISVLSDPDPNKIRDDRSRQRASIQRELETQYKGVYVDFTPPSSFPNCETGNSDTLYAIYCDRGSPQKSQTTVISNNIDEKNRKKLDYENTLRGLGFTNPEASFTPFDRNASCGSTSPPDNLSKAKEVILKYCDNGNIITVNKIIPYTNENDFNTKLIQYKQQLIGQNGILTSVRLSINDPKVSIGIDQNPADPTCGGPKITKVYITFCQSNNTVGRLIADVAVDNSKPYNIFQASIDSVIKEQVTDKGGKNPRYNIGSYPSDPTCIESSGGGNEGGEIRNGTLKVQIQFEENGLIVDAFTQLRPAVNVNGSKPLPSFIDSNLLKLGPSASSYTYEIDNKSYFTSPSSPNTLTFSNIPGWVTPSPFTFFLQKVEDNAPPGTRQFGNYYLFRYTRTTGGPGGGGSGGGGTTEEPEIVFPPSPGPSGPGPDGPGPTPPPATTTFRPTTTTTTRFIPIASWLKPINSLDNRKYVFDVTEGLFSNNVRNLITFFTGSTSENYSRYYTHVYDENPKTSLTSSIQFSIAYGHSGGSGSLDEGNKINITPTRAIYSQYRNLVLGRPDVKFNLTGRDTDSIYVVNYQSKRLKDRLDAGVLELNIAHLSGSRFLAGGGTRATHTGSNVKLAGTNRVLRLIDDSKINVNSYIIENWNYENSKVLNSNSFDYKIWSENPIKNYNNSFTWKKNSTGNYYDIEIFKSGNSWKYQEVTYRQVYAENPNPEEYFKKYGIYAAYIWVTERVVNSNLYGEKRLGDGRYVNIENGKIKKWYYDYNGILNSNTLPTFGKKRTYTLNKSTLNYSQSDIDIPIYQLRVTNSNNLNSVVIDPSGISNSFLSSKELFSKGKYGVGDPDNPQEIEVIERYQLTDLDTESYYIIEDVSDIDDLLYGNCGYPYPQFWGQQRADCTDCTFTFYNNFIKNGTIESDYMTEDQKKYLLDNIDDMFMYDGGVTKIDGLKIQPNCHLREGSRTIVIKKK